MPRFQIFLIVSIIFAGAMLLPAAGSAQTPDSVVLSISCRTNPETTTFYNNLSVPVTVISLTSIFHPTADEPFNLDTKVAPGGTVTFYSGVGSPGSGISQQPIYDDNDFLEGAQLITSAGILTVLCSVGTTSRAGPPNVPTTTPSPTPTPLPTSTPRPAPVAPPESTVPQSVAAPSSGRVLITPPSTGSAGLTDP